MIEETVRIVGVEADAVWVEAERKSTCGRCALRAGCGHGLLDSWRRGPVVHLRLPAPAADRAMALAIGDAVVIGLEESVLLGASFRLYGLPLFGFIVGALLGDSLAGDAGALAAGCVGAGLGFLGASLRRAAGEVPRILRRAPSAGALEMVEPVTIV